MKINDQIVKAYLENGNINEFRNAWYFTSSTVAGDDGNNIFNEPKYDDELKRKAELVCQSIKQVASDFLPTNLELWDTLFSDWRRILSEVSVDLIAGFPEPYDATVERDGYGVPHIVFDVICWTKYVGKCDMLEVVQNLLTHELCHVLIGNSIANIDKDIESKDYLTNLNANAFHEAFAHLISYETKEIHTIDWHTPRLEKVRVESNQRLKDSLAEMNPEIQQQNLYDAICGNYYEKFACMSGMLYLAEVWEKGGKKALKECFDEGYKDFVLKILK